MQGYPYSTNIETVHDGAESAMFKQLFQKWTVQDQTVGLGKTYTVGQIGKKDLLAWLCDTSRVQDEIQEHLRLGDLHASCLFIQKMYLSFSPHQNHKGLNGIKKQMYFPCFSTASVHLLSSPIFLQSFLKVEWRIYWQGKPESSWSCHHGCHFLCISSPWWPLRDLKLLFKTKNWHIIIVLSLYQSSCSPISQLPFDACPLISLQ